MAQVKDGNGNYGGVVGGMSDADIKNLGSATRSAHTTQNDTVNAAATVLAPLADECVQPINSFSETNRKTIPPVVAEVREGESS